MILSTEMIEDELYDVAMQVMVKPTSGINPEAAEIIALISKYLMFTISCR